MTNEAVDAIIYLKTISNIIELYKINILSKIMPVSNYHFVIIHFNGPLLKPLTRTSSMKSPQIYHFQSKKDFGDHRMKEGLLGAC